MKNKLVISLVTYNGEKYIPFLFDSLKKQSSEKYDLIVLDNGSADNTFKTIKTELTLSGLEGKTKIIKKEKNIGFTGGHNEIFKQTDSDYFFVLNQDIFLSPNVIEKMVKFLDDNKDVSAVAPRINKWDFDNKEYTEKIDTLGLKVLRSRRVVEIKDEVLKPIQDGSHVFPGNKMEVFGLSGACVMYRRSFIEEVGGLFDDSFFAYKEDIDLSYRLRQINTKSFILLNVFAWHDRTGSEKGLSDLEQSKNKRKQSELIKYNSYRNHLITLYKNEYVKNFIIDFLPILVIFNSAPIAIFKS